MEKDFTNIDFSPNENFPLVMRSFENLDAINEDDLRIMLFSNHKKMITNIVNHKELTMIYSCAIKEIKTKVEILSAEYNVRYQRNPIEFISSRVKSVASIMTKLEKKNLNFSLDNINNEINDIAGIRIICSFIDDIYELAEALSKQSDIEIIHIKDYIAYPKENGYRSLHILLKVPVFFNSATEHVKVEVQIRTIAMDFWASLEHQLKYKQEIANEQEILAELKSCAEIIAQTDQRMQNIRIEIDKNSTTKTEDEILFEKVRKIDLPFN